MRRGRKTWSIHFPRLRKEGGEEEKKKLRVLSVHERSLFRSPRPFVPPTRARVRDDKGMAPDASIRRPSAAEGKANGSESSADSTRSNNATPSLSSAPQSPSPASRLVAPSSLASGFAKFTHKGEDTWANSTDLRVDVPGKPWRRKSEGFPIFSFPSFFSALFLFSIRVARQAPTGKVFPVAGIATRN